MEINIALTATENYLDYTRVTITSILLNANKSDVYNFYILINHISDAEKAKIEKLKGLVNCNFEYILMDDSQFDRRHPDVHPSICYRMVLPSKINKGKVLYMDCDMICKFDIKELYSYDISEYYIAAVEDILGECWGNFIQYDYDKGDKFINGGLLLMNLDKMRADNLEEKILEFFYKRQAWEQDAFNVICKDKTLHLPITYNCMPFPEKSRVLYGKLYVYYRKRFFEYLEALENPKIIHYQVKPWKDSSCMFAQEWFSIKKLTDEICK